MGGITYKIASFNMYKFNFRSDGEIRKDYTTIGKILSDFDIVALQEVLSESALKRLNVELNRYSRSGDRWDCRWAQPRVKTAVQKKERAVLQELSGHSNRTKGFSNSYQEAEGYAFLWKTNRFTLAKKRNGEVREPRIVNQYRTLGFEPLARPPLLGCFNPVAAGHARPLEIRLVNTHITFGSVGDRKREFQILAEIYKKIETDNQHSPAISSYTIMLGDYNLNLKRANTKYPFLCEPLGGEYIEVYEMREQLKDERVSNPETVCTLVTVQDQLSTIKKNDSPKPVTEYMANNYDHFTINKKYIDNMQYRGSSIMNTVSRYCDDDISRHRKEISDHVPIQMEFKV